MLEELMVSVIGATSRAMSKSVLQIGQIRVWGVFFLCFLFSALGVVLSF
jgi:hypothetical protein